MQVVDERVHHVRHGEMPLPTPHYASRAQWEARQRWLREHILLSAGLLPLPPKTPLRARTFGRLERDGYSVEKVQFESFPGFLVTGNLYRPLGKKPPFPVVLCPHGHFQNGRLTHLPEGRDGASYLGLCINLAKQGYVAFAYDMVGYNDSLQLPHQRVAREWELWGIHLLRLQLWNSIRALDFLCSLREVDRNRIGCTGASGGGTQTFLLAAVDPRVTASAPVCMVSAHFQGGCFCENAPGLRLDTNNVEISALAAPRPLLLVGATGDWTRDTMEVEYPAARALYALMGVEERVSAVRFDADHNFNRQSREAVYAFFGRWLGVQAPEQELPFSPEPPEALRLFPNGNLPAPYARGEAVLEALKQQDREQLRRRFPRSPQGVSAFRRWLGAAWAHTLAVEAVEPTQVAVIEERRAEEPLPHRQFVLRRAGTGEAVLGAWFAPTGRAIGKAVLLLHPEGREAWLRRESLLHRLLAEGYAVITLDAFGTGEHVRRFGQRELVGNFPETFHRTDLQWQVQDTLTALAWLRAQRGVRQVSLVGAAQAGWWALLAASCERRLHAVVADLHGCDGSDRFFLQHVWVPGIRRLGDWATAAVLSLPARVLVHHLSPEEARRVELASFAPSITVSPASLSDEETLRWIA
ncbi:MAG: acetylxylan esterase [Armatimonadota bacterium]|nr:acetylxylan esterase [Armatimonadota bacterium]